MCLLSNFALTLNYAIYYRMICEERYNVEREKGSETLEWKKSATILHTHSKREEEKKWQIEKNERKNFNPTKSVFGHYTTKISATEMICFSFFCFVLSCRNGIVTKKPKQKQQKLSFKWKRLMIKFHLKWNQTQRSKCNIIYSICLSSCRFLIHLKIQ